MFRITEFVSSSGLDAKIYLSLVIENIENLATAGITANWCQIVA